MKKMKTLFVIDREKQLAINEINSGCEWIFDKGVTASVKFEGTAAMFLNGKLFKRWDRKLKKKFQRIKSRQGSDFKFKEFMLKDIPEGAIACQEDFDPVTFHQPFWVEVTEDKADQYFNEALSCSEVVEGQTYELIGEKIQGNFYEIQGHKLVAHGSLIADITDFSFESIKKWLKGNNQEGLVFKHPDGRMCKIRRKDFFEFKELNGGRKVDWRDQNIIFN